MFPIWCMYVDFNPQNDPVLRHSWSHSIQLWSRFGSKTLRERERERERERNRTCIYREHQIKRSTCIFNMFPIRNIYVDFHIDSIDHIVFRMIKFWTKNLDRKKSFLYLHIKYYYYPSNVCCLKCFRCEVFILTLILIFLLTLFRMIKFWIKTLEIFTSP